MAMGTALLLIAVGAILRYAVTADASWIDVRTVGVILMVVGIVGFVTSLVWMVGWLDRRRRGSGDQPPLPPEFPPRPSAH
jgi:heme/copper-type cytochrome/quinol oxidase subunit 2